MSGLLRRGSRAVWRRAPVAVRGRRAQAALKRFSEPYRVHVGCGEIRLEGWVNLDLSPGKAVDVTWDIREPMPLRDGTCELIYSEHVLEHLTVEEGLGFLRECRRLLRPGGVLRVAMPSLDVLVEKYANGWDDQAWLRLPEYCFIKTRAEMLNVAFRWWDHRWLYDREELHRRLKEAGFAAVRDVALGCSTVPALSNLETREDSLLICEALTTP